MQVVMEGAGGRMREYSFSGGLLEKRADVLSVEQDLRIDLIDEGELRLDVFMHLKTRDGAAGKRELPEDAADIDVAQREIIASVVLANAYDLEQTRRITVQSGQWSKVVWWRQGDASEPVNGSLFSQERLLCHRDPAASAENKVALEMFVERVDEGLRRLGRGSTEEDVNRLQRDVARGLGYTLEGMGEILELREREEMEEAVSFASALESAAGRPAGDDEPPANPMAEAAARSDDDYEEEDDDE